MERNSTNANRKRRKGDAKTPQEPLNGREPPKRLYRSKEDRMVGGVCGGIAEHFNWDSVWVRLVFVLLIFINGIGILAYLICWIVIPSNPNQAPVKTRPVEQPRPKRRGWKVVLMLLGVFLALLLIASAIIGAFLAGTLYATREARTLTLEAPYENVTHADLRIAYGAGTLAIGSAEANREESDVTAPVAETLVTNRVTTHDLDDPTLAYRRRGSVATVTMEREGGFPPGEDAWEVALHPGPAYTLELEYGAVEATIDLTGLDVEELDLSTGATSTVITFADRPTKTTVETGASTLELRFPEEANVVIDLEGGAVTLDLPGFTKRDGKHYSPAYDEEAEPFDIRIEAGAATVIARIGG